MNKQMIGYIKRIDLELNPNFAHEFEYKEATYTRVINQRGDKIKCKLFYGSLDFEEVTSDTKMVKENEKIMLVRTPLILDDELRDRMKAWVDWANKNGRKAYDPFYEDNGGADNG